MKHLLFYIILCCFYHSVYAQYSKIGDLITNRDGSKGVVFWVSPDGSRGWMVSLRDLTPGFWGKTNVDVPGLKNIPIEEGNYFLALLDTAGYQNTAILRQFQGAGNEYAAQKVDFENGWYVPAVGQAHQLQTVWSEIKSTITKNGGEDLSEKYYWTSSELDYRFSWIIDTRVEVSIGSINKKLDIFRSGIRPIRSFTNTNLTYEWSTGETTPSVTVKPKTTTDYSVKMTSAEGWSVTATQSITVNPTYLTPIQASIPNGGHYDFGGKELTAPGTYTDTLTSVSGCDSIVQLTLTAHDSYFFESTDTICKGDSINFRGKILHDAGVYDDSLRTTTGRDSIFRLHLTVNPTHCIESNESICKGETYTFRGNTYNTTGTYDDSLKTTVTECDSIFRLHLTVNPTYFFEESETICKGKIYNFHGRELTEPRVYYDSLRTVTGCDSVYKLTLAVNPTYLSPESETICQGEVYRFRGREFNSTGTYDDTLETVAGCDSIFRLHLRVNPTYHPVIDTLICRGERYAENGFNETESGEYTQRLSTVHECDSVVTLRLRVADYFDGDIEMALEDCRTHEYSFAAKNRGVADDYDYLWDFGDGNTAEEAEIVHHYADSGMYSVRLTVTAANRCAKEMSMPVQVPYFSEDFEIVAEPAEIDEAHPEIGFSTACVPGLTYLWEFGDGASGTGCKTAHQYALQEKSWYQVRLTVSNQEDCSTEEEMQIMSWSKVKGINTFSPNGDNVNDVFREGFHIKVFNRNGVLIFEGENGWDGSYKGKQVEEGVYFYEADNFSSQGARKDNGYITVIR